MDEKTTNALMYGLAICIKSNLKNKIEIANLKRHYIQTVAKLTNRSIEEIEKEIKADNTSHMEHDINPINYSFEDIDMLIDYLKSVLHAE
jgi:hypothetical protein